MGGERRGTDLPSSPYANLRGSRGRIPRRHPARLWPAGRRGAEAKPAMSLGGESEAAVGAGREPRETRLGDTLLKRWLLRSPSFVGSPA